MGGRGERLYQKRKLKKYESEGIGEKERKSEEMWKKGGYINVKRKMEGKI